MIRLLLAISLLSVLALPAQGQLAKETYALCTGAGVCALVTPGKWGLGTKTEYSLDRNVGCPANATYSVGGGNAGGQISHNITILSATNLTSDTLVDGNWYPTLFVTASDITGCTDLRVNLWVERPTR